MVIGNRIKSDHSPIEMRVQWKGMIGNQERARKGEEKRSIMKWEEGGVKKGERKEVENYRGITLMDTGYKIYAEIVRKRLERELEEKKVLDETQVGVQRRQRTGRGNLCTRRL